MTPTWATPGEFAVLVVLANYANPDGVAWPSKPTIARRVGLKTRQVWNIVHSLEADGLIAIEAGAGPRGCDRFTLMFGEAETTTPATHYQSAAERPRQPIARVETWTPATHYQSESGHHTAPRNDPGNQVVVTPAIANDDPGNGSQRLRQPIATNPKDPTDPKEEPAAVLSKQEHQERHDRLKAAAIVESTAAAGANLTDSELIDKVEIRTGCHDRVAIAAAVTFIRASRGFLRSMSA